MIYIILGSLIPFFFYLNRFLLPDLSFDTINYHLLIGERGLHNWLFPFANNEFFPTGLHTFSPLFQTFGAFFRQLFGYRLGTLPSLIGYIFIVIFVYRTVRLLSPHFFSKTHPAIRLVLFLNAIVVFELLAQVATYFTDVTGTAFVVAGFYYFVRFLQGCSRKDVLMASFLFGVALWGKLTNAVFVLPYWIIVCVILVRNNFKTEWKTILFQSILVFLPIGIFSLKLWLMTGNPVFPFFNSVFHSPYFNSVSFSNPYFGPKNVFEIIAYPVVSVINKHKLGELEAFFYDRRVSLYFLLLLFIFIHYVTNWKKNRTWVVILIYFFSSYYLWAVLFGYLRYAAPLELIGGIILCSVLGGEKINLRMMATLSIISALLLIGAYRVVKVNLGVDYAWRTPMLREPSLHANQVRSLFSDKPSLGALDAIIGKSDFYLNCDMPSSGYVTFQKKQLPIILSRKLAFDYGVTELSLRIGVNRIFSKKDRARFLIILRSDGPNPNMKGCLGVIDKVKNLKQYDLPQLNAVYRGTFYLLTGEIDLLKDTIVSP